jgi:putative hydrolase of the HAD superfamily
VSRRVSVLLLDLDDTLVVDDADVLGALYATCAEAAGSADPDALFRGVWRRAWASRSGGVAAAAERLGIGAVECLIADFDGCHASLEPLRRRAPELRRSIWRDALVEAGAGSDGDELAETLSERLRSHRRSRYTLRPGAAELLDAAASRFRLALVSNGAPDLQAEKLVRTGIGPRFEAVVVSGVEGVRKPDPCAFALALDRLGATPAEALVVGDDATDDGEGARAAGIDCVLVRRDDVEPPDPSRPTLDDVRKRLLELAD